MRILCKIRRRIQIQIIHIFDIVYQCMVHAPHLGEVHKLRNGNAFAASEYRISQIAKLNRSLRCWGDTGCWADTACHSTKAGVFGIKIEPEYLEPEHLLEMRSIWNEHVLRSLLLFQIQPQLEPCIP